MDYLSLYREWSTGHFNLLLKDKPTSEETWELILPYLPRGTLMYLAMQMDKGKEFLCHQYNTQSQFTSESIREVRFFKEKNALWKSLKVHLLPLLIDNSVTQEKEIRKTYVNQVGSHVLEAYWMGTSQFRYIDDSDDTLQKTGLRSCGITLSIPAEVKRITPEFKRFVHLEYWDFMNEPKKYNIPYQDDDFEYRMMWEDMFEIFQLLDFWPLDLALEFLTYLHGERRLKNKCS